MGKSKKETDRKKRLRKTRRKGKGNLYSEFSKVDKESKMKLIL